MKIQIVITILFLSFTAHATAKVKEGLQISRRPSQAQEYTVTGPLKKFSEIGPRFEVVIEKSAAIYLLPKDKNADKTRAFLQKAEKDQTEYIWEIDPMAQQIYQVRPVQ